MTKHAKLSPSSAHRWLACTASVCLTPPKDAVQAAPSSYALEGTAMHEILEKKLDRGISIDGHEIICGVEITEAHKRNVRTAFEEIEKIKNDLGPSVTYTEYLVSSKKLGRDMFGTADVIVDSRKELFVIDYKSGSGLEVEAENNSQLAFYGLCAIEEFKRPKLTMVIVQPGARSGSVTKRWEIDDVDKFKTNWYHQFQAAKHRAENWASLPEGQKYLLGPHCKWCPVDSVCPERFREAMDMFPVLDKEPNEKTDLDHISKILDAKERIIEYIKSLEEIAKRRLQIGKQVPGYKLVRGKTMRKIISEQNMIKEMSKQFNEDDFVVKKLRTLKELEKLAGREFVDKFTLKSTPKIVLAPLDDKREAINCFEDFEVIE